ncbi:MAG: SGNH/GDSL hydrolase family protein [Bacteroidota bacterium]
MKILRTFKIIAINVLTFAILLIIINWACGLYLRSRTQGSRDQLPNFANDQQYARKVFKDYNSVQHEYEPFVGWKMLPYKGETLFVNKDGLRMHTPPAYDASREKTVRFFGGSTMWGEGSDDQHTIAALFHDKNPKYKVVNHAQLAYNTRQELDALITLYSKTDSADIVIFYDGVNDAAFLCPKDIKELPAHRLVPMFREKLYVGKSAFVKDLLKKIFVENILKAIFAFTHKPSAENSPYDCLSKPGKAEEIADIFIKNWEMAHQIVTQRGGKFIAVLQPAVFIGNPRSDHLQLDPDFGNNFKEVYKHIQQKIKERNHDWIFDLTDKFDGQEYIYIDFCHVSPNGNDIVSREITNIVARVDQ